MTMTGYLRLGALDVVRTCENLSDEEPAMAVLRVSLAAEQHDPVALRTGREPPKSKRVIEPLLAEMGK